MNDLAQLQPAFNNGVNTLLAVSTNIETEQITNGNLKLKGNSSFGIWLTTTVDIMSFSPVVGKLYYHVYQDIFLHSIVISFTAAVLFRFCCGVDVSFQT
jgi:hypothetical protein